MTKKLSSILFSLFLLTDNTSYATDKKPNPSSSCSQSINYSENGICCIPGPKGKRGPRGKRGKRGTSSSCGPNELFITAIMMTGCDSGVVMYPTPDFAYVYQGCTAIPVWSLPNPLVMPMQGASSPFDVPNDLDNTKPVTVIVHILVPSTDGPPVGSMANLEVQMAYLTNNEIGGIVSPATGFDDTEFSGDFTIIPPDTVTTDYNVRQLSIPISLDPTLLIPGNWAFISVARTPAATDEYDNIIWLSSVSIQYTRLCS